MARVAASEKFQQRREWNPDLLAVAKNHAIIFALRPARERKHRIASGDFFERASDRAAQCARARVIHQLRVERARHFDIIRARAFAPRDFFADRRVERAGDG